MASNGRHVIWSRVETPPELGTWRFLVEKDLDEFEAVLDENRRQQRRLVQLTGGALVALLLNLVLLVVTLGVQP